MLLALVFPASALAHTPAATVSCTGSQFTWTDFRNGTNTVHWRVTVDGATFQEGTTTFQGNVGGSQTVPYTLNDTHTVQAYSWWDAADDLGRQLPPRELARARLADTDLPRRGATGGPAGRAAGRGQHPGNDARLGRRRHRGRVGDRRRPRAALLRLAHGEHHGLRPADPAGDVLRQRPPGAHGPRALEPAARDGRGAALPRRCCPSDGHGAGHVPQRRGRPHADHARDALRAGRRQPAVHRLSRSSSESGDPALRRRGRRLAERARINPRRGRPAPPASRDVRVRVSADGAP